MIGRVRSSSRHRHFVKLPELYNTNNDNDLILNSVICWAFYPKLLKREDKGWRNVANNQVVSLHPTSVNKWSGAPSQWLSFYHIMQSSSKYEGFFCGSGKAPNGYYRFYNAHETSAVEALAVALACGDAEFKVRLIPTFSNTI